MCAEISHKIMRRETIYDMLNQLRSEERDFRAAAEKALLGLTVLTEYNNKTYRIDDIKWDKSPKSTFDMAGKQVNFIEYYKVRWEFQLAGYRKLSWWKIIFFNWTKRYNLVIRDHNQPLLLTKPKMRDIRGKQLTAGAKKEEDDEKETLLVPELCRATGLTENMRSNFR